MFDAKKVSIALAVLTGTSAMWSAHWMKTILLLVCTCLALTTIAMPAPTPEYTPLSRTANGFELRREIISSPEGGRTLRYQTLGKKAQVLKTFSISDTSFNVKNEKNPHAEQISENQCQAELKSLAKELHRMKLKRVFIHEAACSQDRMQAVTVPEDKGAP